MPSHVPYYPVNNGYYYFRPYNYFHVTRQREEAVQMGLNYNAPYSRAPFEEIYREMESSYDFPNEESEAVYHQRVQELPNLQDILKMQ
ncbi:MAG: hypothetical protein HUJ26_03140 [Planctomycetaceae bacterium]|nr:hypothetical protein [Planctomycetaceae bacterium]